MTRVIVISGGSDGLGKTVAKHLSDNNQVIILSKTEERLEKTAEEINCDSYVCDITNFSEIKETIEKIIGKHGRIDVLINNAGSWIQDKLIENDYERISDVIDVNTKGTIYLTKGVLPHMLSKEDGLVINVISQAGINSKEERSIYVSSKWAITGFTKSLEKEVAKDGIRVTGLYPGKLKTEMFKKMGIDKDMSDGLDTKEVARLIEFIINSDKDVSFPEVGIKNIRN